MVCVRALSQTRRMLCDAFSQKTIMANLTAHKCSFPFHGTICGVISSVFLNAITVALRPLSSGRFSLQGCWDISHRKMICRAVLLGFFSNRSGSRDFTWPRYFCGLGSKSSTELIFFLTGFEYSCFSKEASDIRNALSFLFRGGFHRHGRDVHGTGSFSTALPPEARLRAFGFRAESACSKADTCVQLADCLKGAQLITNANRTNSYNSPCRTFTSGTLNTGKVSFSAKQNVCVVHSNFHGRLCLTLDMGPNRIFGVYKNFFQSTRSPVGVASSQCSESTMFTNRTNMPSEIPYSGLFPWRFIFVFFVVFLRTTKI